MNPIIYRLYVTVCLHTVLSYCVVLEPTAYWQRKPEQSKKDCWQRPAFWTQTHLDGFKMISLLEVITAIWIHRGVLCSIADLRRIDSWNLHWRNDHNVCILAGACCARLCGGGNEQVWTSVDKRAHHMLFDISRQRPRWATVATKSSKSHINRSSWMFLVPFPKNNYKGWSRTAWTLAGSSRLSTNSATWRPLWPWWCGILPHKAISWTAALLARWLSILGPKLRMPWLKQNVWIPIWNCLLWEIEMHV